jgi:DNA repair protein RadC
MKDSEVLERASQIIFERKIVGKPLTGINDIKTYLEFKMAKHDREVFGVILLAGGHRVIEYRELFFGSIAGATVYPREILKAILETNAVAVILVHSHPFNDPTPSSEDISMTKSLRIMVESIGAVILDHVIVGEDFFSMRFQGYSNILKG